jgi:redox-sensitive bicupin YhaK (pirin superfamily)
MAVLKPGFAADLRSANGATAMLLGGAPLDGPRFIEWNFASSSRERIEAAKLAWSEQRMGQVPGEIEWIPLPPPRREQQAPEA